MINLTLKRTKVIQLLKEKPKFLGVLCVLTSVFIFSLVNLAVKDTGNSYPVIQVLFIRFSFALIPLSLLMGRGFSLKTLFPKTLGLSIFIGAVSFVAVGFLFVSLRTLPLADAQALCFSSSLFVTALAFPLIGEKVGLHRWISVIIGFIGVLIVVRPSSGLINYGAMFALGFSLCQAVVLLYVRVILKKDNPLTLTLFVNLVATAMTLPFLMFYWEPMTFKDFALLAVMGIGSGLAQFLLTSGYKYAEASFLSPFLYSALIWGILFDLFIYAHLPSVAMLVGSAIIIISSLYILIRDNQSAKSLLIPK